MSILRKGIGLVVPSLGGLAAALSPAAVRADVFSDVPEAAGTPSPTT